MSIQVVLAKLILYLLKEKWLTDDNSDDALNALVCWGLANEEPTPQPRGEE